MHGCIDSIDPSPVHTQLTSAHFDDENIASDDMNVLVFSACVRMFAMSCVRAQRTHPFAQ